MSYTRIALLGLSLTVLTACSDSDPEDPPPPSPEPSVASLQFLHASPDAPAVDIQVDGETLLEGVGYAQGTALESYEAGSVSVELTSTLPDGSVVTGIGPLDVELAEDTETILVATGKVVDETLQSIIVSRPAEPEDIGSVSLQLAHAAPDAPTLAVFVDDDGEGVDLSAPLATLAFGEATDPLSLTPGDYYIVVTLADDPQTQLFSTGSAIALQAEQLLVTAIANTGPGDSPIQLVLQGETSPELNEASSQVLLSADTPAEIKVAHAAPGIGPVDIFASAGDASERLVEGLAYAAVAPLCTAAAGEYAVDVAPAGQGIEASVITQDVPVAAGVVMSAVTTVVNGVPAVLLTQDDDRRVATQVSVKLTHAAPDAGLADLYVTPSGEVTLDEIQAGTVTPTVADLALGATSEPLAFMPGDYDVRILTESGGVIDAPGGSYAAGAVYSVALAGPETLGGGPTGLSLLLLDNSLCDPDDGG